MAFWIGTITSFLFVIIWAWFFYSRDPHPEKLAHIIRTITFGVISFALSFILILPLPYLMGTNLQNFDQLFLGGSVALILLFAFSEEFSKLLILRFILTKEKGTLEHMDGVLHGGLMGLGFAAIENVFYAIQLDPVSSITRALLIPLLHAATGAILGFFIVERLLSDSPKHPQNLLFALSVTTIAHALYNYFAVITEYVPIALLLTLLMWLGLLLGLGYVFNVSRIRDIILEGTQDSISQQSGEQGRTYAFLGFMSATLGLLYFPILFGPIGITLGLIAQRKRAYIWGQRAVYYGVFMTILGFILSWYVNILLTA